MDKNIKSVKRVIKMQNVSSKWLKCEVQEMKDQKFKIFEMRANMQST